MHNRTDANHSEIVSALQTIGATVQDLSQVGSGCPDILVGWRKVNYLMEIKPEGMRNKKNGGLKNTQPEWHANWRGHKSIVYDEMDAFRVLGISEATLEQMGYVGI